MPWVTIDPEKVTAPDDKRSKWASRVIQGLGPITSESETPAGTVLSIFSKIVKQVFSKADAEDMALIVALPSEEKMRRSDLVVTLGPWMARVSNWSLLNGFWIPSNDLRQPKVPLLDPYHWDPHWRQRCQIPLAYCQNDRHHRGCLVSYTYYERNEYLTYRWLQKTPELNGISFQSDMGLGERTNRWEVDLVNSTKGVATRPDIFKLVPKNSHNASQLTLPRSSQLDWTPH